MVPPPSLVAALLQPSLMPEQAIALQLEWQNYLKNAKTEAFRFQIASAQDVPLVAGVDVAYPKIPTPARGIASAVLWDAQSSKQIADVVVEGDVLFPYIPGLLGFREASLMADAVRRLPQQPSIVLCDGHGYAHPRRFGEAVHVGVLLDLPSIGVAKSPFFGTGDWTLLPRKRGSFTGIFDKAELIGYAACLGDHRKPVFVSAGNGISLEVALQVALQTTLSHRQPEPLFLADQRSRNRCA